MSRADVETRLKRTISGCVANSYGEEYRGYYPISDDDLLVFGAQGIGVDDGAAFMINESNFVWFGNVLVSSERAEIVAPQVSANPSSASLLKCIDEIEFSVRTTIGLKSENIVRVSDLVQRSEAEMLRIPNFGRKSLNEVKEVLKSMGLHFGMEVSH